MRIDFPMGSPSQEHDVPKAAPEMLVGLETGIQAGSSPPFPRADPLLPTHISPNT